MNSLFVAAELPIYSISGEIIKLPVVLKLQANNNQILGVINGRLKIAINETPVNGMANKVHRTTKSGQTINSSLVFIFGQNHWHYRLIS